MKLKDLDAKINLAKKMYFKAENQPNKEISFEDAVSKLAELIGKKGQTIGELAEIVGTALAKSDKKVQSAFFVWVGSIHNDNLTPPEGARFPNNIVYDIISSLRAADDLSPEAILLKLFVEGSNGRKIAKGNTPHPEYIATVLMVDALVAYEKLGNTLSVGEQKFLVTYKGFKEFAKPTNDFENAVTGLKTNSVYSLLTAEKALTLSKTRNEETGANKYHVDTAVEASKKLLSGVSVSDEDVQSLIKVAKSLSPALLEATGAKTAEELFKRPDYSLAAWDISERASWLYSALKAIATLDGSKHPEADAIFKQDPILGDIITRSREGNFPANERNNLLKNVELTEVYLQDSLAKSQAVALVKRDFNLIEAGLQK